MDPLRDIMDGGFLIISYLMSLVFTHSFVGSAKEGGTYWDRIATRADERA